MSLLSKSYRFCTRLTRQSGSNFVPAFQLLDHRRRAAMEVLYAFMRQTDDLADSDAPPAIRREALASWRAGLRDSLRVRADLISTGAPDDPSWIWPALRDIVDRYAIPPEHLEAVIDGVEMDLTPRRFVTFDETAEYCHRVASAVGLACIYIWGFHDARALDAAKKCGLAFQLTNLLRDLKEDIDQDRLYLPEVDLRAAGYDETRLREGVVDEGLKRLMAMEIARAKQLYHEGADLIDYLDRPGRRIFGMMTDVYWHLLLNVEAAHGRWLSERVGVGKGQLVRALLRWFLLPVRRSALP